MCYTLLWSQVYIMYGIMKGPTNLRTVDEEGESKSHLDDLTGPGSNLAKI